MKNLRIIREKKKQTQLNLGMEVGVQQETISAYENGKAMPTAETLLKLAKHFNCSADYLLDLTDISTPVHSLVIGNLNASEADLISSYRALGHDSKNKVIGYIKALQ